MFLPVQATTRTVKGGGARSESEKRFVAFRESVSRRLNAMDPASAIEVLKIADRALHQTEYVSRWYNDAAWHFAVSSSDPLKGRMITDAIRVFRPRNCLELGTAYGLGTTYIAVAQRKYVPGGKTWTIESSDEQFAFSSRMLDEVFGAMVLPIAGLTSLAIPEVISHGFDFVFHDAGHSLDDYVQDFACMLPGLNAGAVVVFDDIRWDGYTQTGSPARCYEGWLKVVEHPRVEAAFEVNGEYGVALIGRP